MIEIARPDDIPEDIWRTAITVANAVGAGLAIGSQEIIGRALLAERVGKATSTQEGETTSPTSGQPEWLGTTSEKDWLINGSSSRSEHQREIWAKLDWSRARMDMGPSPAGNPGPYWHVPWDCDGEELWARLYPKLLNTKWLPVVRHAILTSRRAPAGA